MGTGQSSYNTGTNTNENPSNNDSLNPEDNLLRGPLEISDILDFLTRQVPLGMAEITVNRVTDSDSADVSSANEREVRVNVVAVGDFSESESSTSLRVPSSLVTNRRRNRLGRVNRRSLPTYTSDSSNSLTPQVSSAFLAPRAVRFGRVGRVARNSSRSPQAVRSILRPIRNNDANHPAARPVTDTAAGERNGVEEPLVTVSAPSVLTPPGNVVNSFFGRSALPPITRNTPRTVRTPPNDMISSMFVQSRGRTSVFGQPVAVSGPIMAGDIVQEATPVHRVSFAQRLVNNARSNRRRRSSRFQNLRVTTSPAEQTTLTSRRQVRRRFNTLLGMIRRAQRHSTNLPYQEPVITSDALENLQRSLQVFSTEVETLLEEVH